MNEQATESTLDIWLAPDAAGPAGCLFTSS